MLRFILKATDFDLFKLNAGLVLLEMPDLTQANDEGYVNLVFM